MKRENRIIIRILCELEKSDVSMSLSAKMFKDEPELDDRLLETYLEFMMEHSLIAYEGHNDYKITWEGQDFLGFSSDPFIWRAAHKAAGHLSFDCFYTILKDLMFWKARKTAEEILEDAEWESYKKGKRQ
jgi:predicted transcriptional regulator